MTVSMVVIVEMACEDLSDLELAALNLVAQTEQSPHGRIFDYNDVDNLFTEAKGTKMHDETRQALAVVVNRRLGGKK